MLPPNILTIPQIQHERHAGSKLMYLTTLLEFVLKIYNPNVTAAEEGKEPKVGERVIACQQIFNNFTRVLWALKVRNSFAHVIEGASFSERDHRNAVDCLIEAIGDVCRQAALPRALVEEIYRDPGTGLRTGKELEARSAIGRAIGSGLRKLVVLALLGIGGFFFWPKAVMLYKGVSAVRTEAEPALKQVKERRKQREYSASAKTPATTPTMKPEPVRPSPTVFSPPAAEKPPEPTPPKVRNNEDEIFTIGEKEFMRYVVKRVNPVISPQAKSAGVSGTVVIEVWLSKAGLLSKATVVRGDPLLRESALAALRQWSFRPYQLDRVPTDIRSEITIYVR